MAEGAATARAADLAVPTLAVVVAVLGGSPVLAQGGEDHHVVMPAVFDFVLDSTAILVTDPFPARPGLLETACLEDARDTEARLSEPTRRLFEHWVYDQLALPAAYECRAAAGTPTGWLDRRDRPAVRILVGITYPTSDSIAASFQIVADPTPFGWVCRFLRGSRRPLGCAPISPMGRDLRDVAGPAPGDGGSYPHSMGR